MELSQFASLNIPPPVESWILEEAFHQDAFSGKVNLITGAYRDDEGKPWVLPIVRSVEEKMVADKALDKEYLPVLGYEPFTTAATKILLGEDSPSLEEGRATGIQCLSGTGALRVGADFLVRVAKFSVVYASNPTWGNHKMIFSDAGFRSYRTYRYWDAAKKALDFDGMMDDLRNAPKKSVIILQGCAHNPTGVDPTQDQWKQIADLMKERELFPFFDTAYQGFASGDFDMDAWSVRLFDAHRFEMLCAQSFSKNFGLYNERVGNLTFIGKDASVIGPVRAEIALLIRANYCNPPSHGALIVGTVLNDPVLRQQWKEQIKVMANRISSMRVGLKERLENLGTPGNWNHITEQIGMVSFFGLCSQTAETMVDTHHIYLFTKGEMCGRINFAALNSKNIDYVAKCIHLVITSK